MKILSSRPSKVRPNLLVPETMKMASRLTERVPQSIKYLQMFEWHARLANHYRGMGRSRRQDKLEGVARFWWYGSMNISDRLQGQSEEIEVSQMQQLDAVGCFWMLLDAVGHLFHWILSIFV